MVTPMSPLAEEIEGALKGRTIAALAQEWGIPRWVLDDARHNRLKMPGGPYLVAIARGMGMSVEELLEKIAPQEITAAP